jgi:hypothetical protein
MGAWQQQRLLLLKQILPGQRLGHRIPKIQQKGA